MHKRRITFLVVGFLGVIAICGATAGQALAQGPQDVQYERWMKFYEDEVKSIQIHLDDDRKSELVLQEEPVLRWTNPERANEIHGAVYLWTHEGRAEVMGTVWSNVTNSRSNNRTVGHQFHSLSTRPLVARKDGVRFWYPRRAGIDPRPIPGAPRPAESRSLRLAQMRSLAREFQGDGEEFLPAGGSALRGIRLLSQPLHRQEKPLDDYLDGALFTFAMGTDPEVILLIEARPTDEGYKWHYSIGRFSGLQTNFRYRGEIVWTYRGPSQQFEPEEPYLSNYSVRVMPKELPETVE